VLLMVACGLASRSTEPTPSPTLSPGLLLPPPAPSVSAAEPGPTCALRPKPGEVIAPFGTLLEQAPVLEACWVRYVGDSPQGIVGGVDISHAVLLLPTAELAARLVADAPGLLSRAAPGRASVEEPVRGVADEAVAFSVERDDRAAFSTLSLPARSLVMRHGPIVTVLTASRWPGELPPGALAQLARVVASKWSLVGNDAPPPTPWTVVVPVRAFLVGETPGAAATRPYGRGAIPFALGRAQDIYNQNLKGTGVTLRLALQGVTPVPPPETLDSLEGSAALAGQHADPCRLSVFYVAREEVEVGAWSWLPASAVFFNTGAGGERLARTRFHARILAHEMGHLWGLPHVHGSANLMYPHAFRPDLDEAQASLVAAYLDLWLATCPTTGDAMASGKEG